jgi:hypothetical protein
MPHRRRDRGADGAPRLLDTAPGAVGAGEIGYNDRAMFTDGNPVPEVFRVEPQEDAADRAGHADSFALAVETVPCVCPTPTLLRGTVTIR